MTVYEEVFEESGTLGDAHTVLTLVGVEEGPTLITDEWRDHYPYETVDELVYTSYDLTVYSAVVLRDFASISSDIELSKLVAVLHDAMSVMNAVGVNAKFGLAIAKTVKVLETMSAGQPVSVGDMAEAAHVLTAAMGATLAERLSISHTLSYPFVYGRTVTERLRALDAVAFFLHFDLADTITISDSSASIARYFAALEDSGDITDALGTHFLLSVEAHDDGVLGDDFDINAVFNAEVREHLTISALFVSPDGGITAWTVNTRTGAVTEYENFNFNSFAQSGVHYLGASDEGLYVLDGTDDDGVPTTSHLKSGYAQFGGSRLVSFKAAYLGIRGSGDIILKLDTGDGKTYTYRTVIQSQQSTKVRFGKGLRARYFAFELITEGADYDLDSIEFIPLVAQRRV